MKWMLTKCGRREKIWCRMLKGEKYSVEYGKDVETFVYDLLFFINSFVHGLISIFVGMQSH